MSNVLEFIGNNYESYTQSKEFAEYVKYMIGDTPIFLDLDNNGYCLVFKTKKFLRKHYWWKGNPVINNPNGIEYFKKWLSGKRFNGSTTQKLFDNDKEWNTSYIDLHQSINSIIDNADKTQVKNILKRNRKKGINIRNVVTSDNILEYYKMLKPDYSFAKFSYNLKSKYRYSLMALLDKIPIGFLSFIAYNGIIQEQGIAHKRIKGIYPIDTLRLHGMLLGKTLNCNYYDLAGFNPKPETQKEIGIARNKKKWNGIEMTYYLQSGN